MSGEPPSAEPTLTAISGALVPKATTVRPMISEGMPAAAARREAPRTSSSAPSTSTMKPPMRRTASVMIRLHPGCSQPRTIACRAPAGKPRVGSAGTRVGARPAAGGGLAQQFGQALDRGPGRFAFGQHQVEIRPARGAFRQRQRLQLAAGQFARESSRAASRRSRGRGTAPGWRCSGARRSGAARRPASRSRRAGAAPESRITTCWCARRSSACSGRPSWCRGCAGMRHRDETEPQQRVAEKARRHAAGDHQVGLFLQQRLGAARQHRFLHFHARVRALLAEGGEGLEQRLLRKDRIHREPHRGAQPRASVSASCCSACGFLQQVARATQQGLAGRRQHRPASLPATSNGRPSAACSCFTPWLTVDWLLCSCSAAWAKPPWSTTAASRRHCSSVAAIHRYYRSFQAMYRDFQFIQWMYSGVKPSDSQE